MPIKHEVICSVQVEGFHAWPGAPGEVGFLESRHRHVFFIKAWFPVEHANRHVEIILTQRLIEKRIEEHWGRPAEFGARSCEHIGEWLLRQFPEMERVEVLEDGMGGALSLRVPAEEPFLS